MNTCTNPLCLKLFNATPGSTGKYCSLSCSTTHRNYLSTQARISNYNKNPNLCRQCNTHLDYLRRTNKFCSTSCSAIFSNARKDYSKIKSGPDKGYVPKNYFPHTKVKPCIVCQKLHPKQGKTCSAECKSIHISNSVRGKTGGNRDCNLPGIDSFGKHFFFDSNWEVQLADSLDKNNIKWHRPTRFILTSNRSYTPDFYLPDYNVYIDPKAKRPDYYRKSILKIEQFEIESGSKCLVISSPKLLHWWHIQSMLLVQNYRS